jgi:glycosyltransferase involved in cell wall biosynthesis
MPAERISVCITCCNEERNIRRCLKSVTWADEVIVVDSFSSDRTPEICREYTSRVFQHEWLGYIGQKNLSKDLATNPWIFFLDADEEVSPQLRDEILELFSSGMAADFAGLEFPRMVHYLGRWITHGDWYPDTKMRLFRKDKGICGGKEPHDRITVAGRVRRLNAPLYHYTYNNIADQLATINNFTTISARTLAEDGNSFRFSYLMLRPGLRFLRGYLLKRGVLDGLPGFIIASLNAYSVFCKYAKLWEFHRFGIEDDIREPPPSLSAKESSST